MDESLKAGARNSANDAALIQEIGDHAVAINATVNALLAARSVGGIASIKSITHNTAVVSGFGVIFGGNDLVGDQFTKSTDFGLQRSLKGMGVWYEHGKHPSLRTRIGEVTDAEINDEGLFLEMEIDRSIKYVNQVIDLVKQGRIGLSTAALSHLIDLSKKSITQWIVGEVSLTVEPAEPRTLGVNTTMETKDTKAIDTKAMYQVNGGTLDIEEVTEKPEEQPSELSAGDATATKSLHDENKELKELLVLREENAALRKKLTAPAIMKSAPSILAPQQMTDDDRARKSFNAFLRGSKKAMDTSADVALVPQSYATEYTQKLSLSSVLRRAGVRVVLNPNGQPYNHPVVTPSAISATPGADIISEGGTMTAVEPSTARVTFTPYIYTARTKVSMQLMDDSSFDVGTLIGNDFVQRFAAHENRDFAVGTGTGMPQGITVGGTSQDTAGATLTVTDIKALHWALPEQYRIAGQCAWFANDATWAYIDSLQAATTGEYFWQPSLQEGSPSRLMGYPVYGLPYMSATRNSGDKVLVFANLQALLIVEFMGLSVKMLDQLYAETGEIGYIAYRRVDHHVLISDAVRVLEIA